jgi:hypothetical protein
VALPGHRAASARSSENGYPSSKKTAGSKDNDGDEASMLPPRRKLRQRSGGDGADKENTAPLL